MRLDIFRQPSTLLSFIGVERVITFEASPLAKVIGDIKASVIISAVLKVDERNIVLFILIDNVGGEQIIVAKDHWAVQGIDEFFQKHQLLSDIGHVNKLSESKLSVREGVRRGNTIEPHPKSRKE